MAAALKHPANIKNIIVSIYDILIPPMCKEEDREAEVGSSLSLILYQLICSLVIILRIKFIAPRMAISASGLNTYPNSARTIILVMAIMFTHNVLLYIHFFILYQSYYNSNYPNYCRKRYHKHFLPCFSFSDSIFQLIKFANHVPQEFLISNLLIAVFIPVFLGDLFYIPHEIVTSCSTPAPSWK